MSSGRTGLLSGLQRVEVTSVNIAIEDQAVSDGGARILYRLARRGPRSIRPVHMYEEVVVVPLGVAFAEVFEEAVQRNFQLGGPDRYRPTDPPGRDGNRRDGGQS